MDIFLLITLTFCLVVGLFCSSLCLHCVFVVNILKYDLCLNVCNGKTF